MREAPSSQCSPAPGGVRLGVFQRYEPSAPTTNTACGARAATRPAGRRSNFNLPSQGAGRHVRLPILASRHEETMASSLPRRPTHPRGRSSQARKRFVPDAPTPGDLKGPPCCRLAKPQYDRGRPQLRLFEPPACCAAPWRQTSPADRPPGARPLRCKLEGPSEEVPPPLVSPPPFHESALPRAPPAGANLSGSELEKSAIVAPFSSNYRTKTVVLMHGSKLLRLHRPRRAGGAQGRSPERLQRRGPRPSLLEGLPN